MERKQLDIFRQVLIGIREEIEQLDNTSKSAAGTVALDQSKVGRLSRMDALQSQQIAKETNRRRQVQLQKIQSALHRLDEGEYGYCLKCGEEIGQGRLNIDPASTRCIRCADS